MSASNSSAGKDCDVTSAFSVDDVDEIAWVSVGTVDAAVGDSGIVGIWSEGVGSETEGICGDGCGNIDAGTGGDIGAKTVDVVATDGNEVIGAGDDDNGIGGDNVAGDVSESTEGCMAGDAKNVESSVDMDCTDCCNMLMNCLEVSSNGALTYFTTTAVAACSCFKLCTSVDPIQLWNSSSSTTPDTAEKRSWVISCCFNSLTALRNWEHKDITDIKDSMWIDLIFWR